MTLKSRSEQKRKLEEASQEAARNSSSDEIKRLLAANKELRSKLSDAESSHRSDVARLEAEIDRLRARLDGLNKDKGSVEKAALEKVPFCILKLTYTLVAQTHFFPS